MVQIRLDFDLSENLFLRVRLLQGRFLHDLERDDEIQLLVSCYMDHSVLAATEAFAD